jgi:flagellin-like protein
MKAITPIISIIILLLITVGLAAAAWTYMDNYLRTLTAKNIEVSTQKCITGAGGKEVMAIVHNMGTATITMANDVVILDETGGVVSGSWTNLDPGTSITEIEAGK